MIRIRTFAKGVLFALLMVASVSVSAQQQQQVPGLGHGSGSGPGGGSGVSEQDVLDANRDVYEGLFGLPWNINTADYNILAGGQYAGELGTFSGVNQLGMPFVLDVTKTEPIDFTQVGLPPQEIAFFQATNAAFANVEVTLSTGLASYSVMAKTASFIDGSSTLNNKLTVGFYTTWPGSGVDGIEEEQPVIPQEGEWYPEPTCWELEINCVTVSWPCVLNTPECNGCVNAFQTKMAELGVTYTEEVGKAQIALNAANSTHTSCKTTSRNVYLTAVAGFEATYLIALKVCAVTGPWAPACVVGASATATVAQVGAAVTYAIVSTNCDTALTIAQTGYNAAMALAKSTREANEAIALQAYLNCLDIYGCNATCWTQVCTSTWKKVECE